MGDVMEKPNLPTPEDMNGTYREVGHLSIVIDTGLSEEAAGSLIGGIVTELKTDFQGLEWRTTPNEREILSSKLCEQSVRRIFETFHCLPKDGPDVERKFSTLYQIAEKEAEIADPDQLMEVLDVFEAHPVLRTIDVLAQVSREAAPYTVNMRKVILVLLAHAYPGNSAQ